MKKLLYLLALLMFCNVAYAQKGLAEYTKAELEQKKAEAEKKADKDEVALLTKAIDLRVLIDKAIASEDYENAAKYKNQLVKLSQGGDKEKIKQLEGELQKAVAAENYEKAAQLKKQIEAEKNGNSIETTVSSNNDSKQVSSANVTSTATPAVEFYNQVYIWDKAKNTTVSLENDTPELKTSSYGGFGYAQATSFWVINGTKSDVVINSNMPISFILKTAPGTNPVDLFRLVKFQILGKTVQSRHMAAFTSQAAAFAGSSTSERRENDVPITFKKVDEGVYEIIVNNQLSTGEYTFYGLGKMYSFSLEGSYANNPNLEIRASETDANVDYYSAGSNTTSYTVNDIYSESNVTWYGVDFSLFRFLFPAKMGQEAALYKYFDAWQDLYSKEVPLPNIKRWLKKPGMTEGVGNVKTLYQQSISSQWIVSDYIQANYLNDIILQKHLKSYTTNSTGLGLVLIPAFFNQKSDNIQVKFVWFDNKTKAIVHVQNVIANAKVGAGLTGHWGNALVEATKLYVDKYYLSRK